MTKKSHIWVNRGLVTLLLVLMVPASACTERLCKTDEACPAGEQCDPESGRCFAPDVDAGDAGADAGDAGADADAQPGCSESAECTESAAPICDDTELECRGCLADPECLARDPARPICDGPACVECTDSAAHCANPAPICDTAGLECRVCAGPGECAALNTATPACDATAGCVQCTDSTLHCSGNLPICEPTTHLCRPCATHNDCDLAGGVCDVSSGACLDETAILYVDNQDPQCSDAGTCTQAIPCCTLQTGVDTVTTGRTTILVANGVYEPIVVEDLETWIIGQDSGAVISPLMVNEHIVTARNLSLGDSTTLTLENLTIQTGSGTGAGVFCTGLAAAQPTLILLNNTLSGNAGGGVTATNCTISMDANTLSGNAGGGVTATNCTISMDANTLSGNAGGGVSLISSEYSLTNNIIVLNGTPGATVGGVSIVFPGSIAEFDSNTVVGNDAQTGEGGIACAHAATVANSIVYDNVGGDISGNCTTSHVWTTDPGFVGGGDYHLAAGSPCIDQGDPASTLDHDVDGETRPQGGGPDIGADERQ
jgi:hypothetical protein